MGRSVKSLMASAMTTSMAVLSGYGAAVAGSGVQDNMGVSNAQISVAAINQTGSGAKANTEINIGTNTETKAEGNSSFGGKTVIEYWHCSAGTQGGLVIGELIKQSNESNDHIQVVTKHNPDMYEGLMQNLQTEAAVGSSPALVQIGWAFPGYFSNNFFYMSPQEATDKFDKEDAGSFRDKFLPNVLELVVNNEGSQVGTPYSLSDPVLCINKDILREAGLPEEGLATWQKVSEFAEAVKEKAGKYGFYMQEPADFWAQRGLIGSSGAKMLTIDVEGKKEAAFAIEDGIETMQLMADMVKDQTTLYVSWEEGCQSFIDGNYAMLYVTTARRVSVQKGVRFDAAAVKSPLWNDRGRMVPAGGCFLATAAQGDDQMKTAREFKKFLYSVEPMAAWTEDIGYMSPRGDMAGAENGLKTSLVESKMMSMAIEQMGGVVPWIVFPGDADLQVEQMLLDMRDQIPDGQATAEQGMKTTQDAINQLLVVQ